VNLEQANKKKKKKKKKKNILKGMFTEFGRKKKTNKKTEGTRENKHLQAADPVRKKQWMNQRTLGEIETIRTTT